MAIRRRAAELMVDRIDELALLIARSVRRRCGR